MDKLREQYKAQKEEEETKRQFYHSPETARHEGMDSNGQLEGSAELSSHSEQTPEPSPLLQQREEREDFTPPSPSHQLQPHPPQPAPKPGKAPPQVAPRPSPGVGQPRGVGQPNGGRVGGSPPTSPAAYNPYPPPSQAAPVPKEDRLPSPQQPAPLPPVSQHVTAPVAPPRGSPDKEALFAFAWYHGSIPRDEALRRLEGVGGYDG